jgi:acetoin utilization deacetylase AcuC-like enzyme
MPLPVVWHPAYEVDIGPHVFPTRKYQLVRDRLLADGTIAPADLARPEPAPDEHVALVHTADYVRKIKTGTLSREDEALLEVPFSPALRHAAWLCAGGSTLTGRLALEQGIAVHLGGGFHHAFPDHGEGFCLINDVAIAIRALQREGVIRRAAVVDLDVHHGNGTAAIFAGDAAVFTFSMHQQHNYPAVKPPSDLDIGLEDGTGDAEYLAALERHLPQVVGRHRPDLVFYLAGADPYRFDQLGGLGLTVAGLRRRDELVFDRALDAGAAVAVSLAGGYALRTDDTVEIHCNTVRAAREVVERRSGA